MLSVFTQSHGRPKISIFLSDRTKKTAKRYFALSLNTAHRSVTLPSPTLWMARHSRLATWRETANAQPTGGEKLSWVRRSIRPPSTNDDDDGGFRSADRTEQCCYAADGTQRNASTRVLSKRGARFGSMGAVSTALDREPITSVGGRHFRMA